MTGPRILVVTDAGAGCVMRALALATALEAQGAGVAFLGPPTMRDVLEAFAPTATRPPMIAAEPEELAVAADRQRFDAVAFDHPGLSEPDHRTIGQGRPVLVVDDRADRPIAADLVADPNPARTAEHYDGLVPAGARLLLGPAFAPVRPEFAALREPALAWRGEPVQRLLVSMGAADPGGITARVVERLRPRVGDAGLDVVVGPTAASAGGLAKIARRDPRLMLHLATPHMARITAEADIGIGATGAEMWERCVLGLPSLLVVQTPDQAPVAAIFAERGAALVADAGASDFEAVFDRALMRLLRDAGLRRQLAGQSALLCDGLGAGRVASAFLALIAARGA